MSVGEWLPYALISLAGVTLFNILQLILPRGISSDNTMMIFYIRLVIILEGIIALSTFLIPGLQPNKKLISKAKDFNILLILGIAITLLIFHIFMLISLSKGGSIVMVVININLVLTLLFGIWILKEKINLQMGIAIIIYIIAGIYILYEKTKLSQ